MAHNCFISYHKSDSYYFEKFVKDFSQVQHAFNYRAVSEMDQNIVDSTDKDYVMRQIREKYLTNTTVTIVLVGQCTWARRYVDWEIASSLRNDPNNKRSGLMAVRLPHVSSPTLPPRFNDNLDSKHDGTSGYAKYFSYPQSASALAACIEDAFLARDTREGFIDNSRDLFGYNRTCP